MTIFYIFFSFIFGAIIGSFLNVVIYRYGTGTIHKGRSMCFSCGTKLTVRDLFPVLSYLFLRGKCRTCKTAISPQYVAVEVCMSLIALLLFLQVGAAVTTSVVIGHVVLYTTLFSLLVAIAVYDYKHKIIPDELSFLFAIGSLLALCFQGGAFAAPSVLDALAGPALALPCAILFFVSRGRWMGLGDAKLFLGVGWFLGFVYGVSAFILSFWIGAAFVLLLMWVAKKKMSGQTQVPFAPFIIVATTIVFFTHVDVFGLAQLLQ